MPHSRSKIAFTRSLTSAGDSLTVDVEDTELLDINALITGGKETFVACSVDGNSMVDLIQPGDIVFVDTAAEVRNGSIILAIVNGYNYVKIYKAPLTLVSANDDYEPTEVRPPKDTMHIVGVVTGAVRTFT